MSQIHTDWWLRWLLQSRTLLLEHRALLNRINVFPVADADTGSNMVTTLGRAADTAGMADEPTLTMAARAALRAARGNSGTLLSVWLLGLASTLAQQQDGQAPAQLPAVGELTPAVLAQALGQAATEARSALSQPADGTMLTLMQAIGRQEATPGWEPYLTGLLAASESSLRATAQASHARNGWVDSGALGFHLILTCLVAELTGTQPPSTIGDLLAGAGPSSTASSLVSPRRSAPRRGPAQVEVMCSIHLPVLEAAQLRSALDTIGDSVSIAQIEAGNEALWAVHVHVADAQDALTLLQAAGQPQDIRITSLNSPDHTHGIEE
ncbi:DAK2 domain-containing protein [Rothia nasimurium]|uniref:DAK2 domain-containing protein n=1 Tax=Rothia nasimurium TaxID=85336 RepID=UPI003BA2E633